MQILKKGIQGFEARSGSLLLSREVNEGLQQVVVDHQGTVGLVVNRCGQRVAELEANPWGLDLFDAAQNPERHRFTGHLRDVHLADRSWGDFDFMHARYYFRYTARSLSVDSGLDYDFSHPQSFNLYAYVRNNPVNLIDPDGRLAIAVVPAWVSAAAVTSATVVWLQSPNITNPRVTNAQALATSLSLLARQLHWWEGVGRAKSRAESNELERASLDRRTERNKARNSPNGPRWGSEPPPGAPGPRDPIGQRPQYQTTPDEKDFGRLRPWPVPPPSLPRPSSSGDREELVEGEDYSKRLIKVTDTGNPRTGKEAEEQK